MCKLKETQRVKVKVKATGRLGTVVEIMGNPYSPFPEWLTGSSYKVHLDGDKEWEFSFFPKRELSKILTAEQRTDLFFKKHWKYIGRD